MTSPSDPTAPSAPGAPTAPSRRRIRAGTAEYEALRNLSKGIHPYPWKNLDYTETRERECTVRVNEWELSVLHYVAGRRRTSLSKLVLGYALEASLKQILEWEGE